MLSRLGLRGLLCGLFLFSGGTWTSAAQDAFPHLVRAESASFQTARPTTGLFTVIALRVEFQPDTTRFSTGDGTFETDPFGGLVPAVDPLPHDAAFFRAHLDALSDYVAKVSDEQAELRTILLPDVVRVSGGMPDYTPIGLEANSDEQLSRLSALIEESWRLADQQIDVALPADIAADRTFFVLLHAGIGRDIELVGTTLDKTPLDIPSIFFDESALGRLGASGLTFGGVPVTNTAVIPRTESRLGFDFIADEPFLVELTTNGLLAASFFNFLGVPDLFNTDTGESAIGPFGLMDPLGIFAYNGLIPPEPSAWTKVYLGWVEPLEVRSKLPVDFVVRAASTATSDVVRIWISDSEYFLVENRHRDVASDGLVMRVWKNGSVSEQRVENGATGFNNVNIDGFSGGVVVGVDDYDWALPGGLDEDDNPLVGGALIWHVDERRIAESIGSNSINSDPMRRGVDLEEADSGQDIGFPAPGFFGPALDQGSPFDFFYDGNPVTVITASGNDVRLYENRFGYDTYPNSRSNGGGPSFIEVAEFSVPGPEMSFVVRRGNGGLARPVDEAGFKLLDVGLGNLMVSAEAGITWCDAAAEPFYAVPVVDPDTGVGSVVIADDNGFVSVLDEMPQAQAQPACSGENLLSLANDGETFRLLESDPRAGTSRSTSLGVSATAFVPASQMLLNGSRAYVAFASEGDGVLAVVDMSDGTVELLNFASQPHGLALAGQSGLAAGLDGRVVVVDAAGETSMEWDISVAGFSSDYGLAFGVDIDGMLGVASGAEYVSLLYPDGSVVTVDLSDGSAGQPVLEDVDGDGRLDVVVPSGDRLTAITRGGAVASGFPIDLGEPVRTQPLTGAGLAGQLMPWLLPVTESGYVFAFDVEQRGRLAPGFPLAASASAVPAWRENRLYTVSRAGDFRVWELEGFGTPRWRESYGDSGNRSYVEISSGDPVPDGAALIVASETYNWPNPIADGRTNFRVATTEDASLVITIVDMAGGRVDQLSVPQVRAGAPFEVLWQTDAQSGVYLARVAATTASGRSDSRLVTFAIIR